MKNRWPIIALLLVVIAASFAVAYFRAQTWRAEERARLVTERAEAQVQAARQAIDQLALQAAELQQRAEAARKVAEAEAVRRAEAERTLAEHLAQVQQAQPHELTAAAHRILDTDEVVWDGERFLFTLAAMRKGVALWAYADVCRTTIIPSYEAEVTALRNQILSLEQTIAVKDEIIAHKDMQITAQEAVSKALRDVIKSERRTTWFAGAVKFTTGFAFGMGAGLVMSGAR